MKESDIVSFVSRGLNEGKKLNPHRNQDGFYVTSRTRFQKDYQFHKELNSAIRNVKELGEGLRMSNPGEGITAPSLISPESIFIRLVQQTSTDLSAKAQFVLCKIKEFGKSQQGAATFEQLSELLRWRDGSFVNEDYKPFHELVSSGYIEEMQNGFELVDDFAGRDTEQNPGELIQ